MIDQHERQVLAALIMRPRLLDLDGRLAAEHFVDRALRRLFQTIVEIQTDGPVEVIDEIDLAHRTNISLEKLQEFQAGSLVPTPDRFSSWVTSLLRRRAADKVIRLLDGEMRVLVKTGEFDLTKLATIRAAWRDIDELEAGDGRDEPTALTAEALAVEQIAKIEWLVHPVVERFGFTLVGAQKGVGKSLFVTQLCLHAAAGARTFLADTITVPKPLRVLLIQQEVSLAGMQDRLEKMRGEQIFELEGRFVQLTTTGAWWNLTRPQDFAKLRRLIEKHKPDVLVLDPLYTFYPRELNTSGDIAPMMEILGDLKTNYGLGLVVVHHFSNKENADDVAVRTAVGRFMGHSMIANSADTTVGLDFLHPKYRQAPLPLPYQNYVTVEITSRHGAWPDRFAIERPQGCLLFQRSSIWDDLGRAIVPGQIEELLEDADGEMLQKDVVQHLSKEARRTTVRRAIEEAVRNGSIIKATLPGKGKPVMLRLAPK